MRRGKPAAYGEAGELAGWRGRGILRWGRRGRSNRQDASAVWGAKLFVNSLKKGYYILRCLGPRIVWLRAGVLLRKRLGWAKGNTPSRSWDDISWDEITGDSVPAGAADYAQWKREHAPPFLFPLGQPPQIPEALRQAQSGRRPTMSERLRFLAEDRCVYFFRYPSPEKIDWYVNPIDKARSDPHKHWSEIPDYLPEQGDPRMLWEPSRAAWAIDLARAAAWGAKLDDDKTAEKGDVGALFWRWVDSWMEACPPFDGFQWKCGQESSVRLIAILLGFWSLASDVATTDERYVQMARLAWATGHRVADHMNYAISQKNNHAISEACGLMLIGHLFPELREAPRWAARGREVLASEIRRQTYDDGAYVQNSMNYQRVMLHGALLALRLGELSAEPLDRDIYERIGRCGDFLHAMMDVETGQLPKYGNNDGAYVLPLSECDFLDFRPVVQAVHFLVHRKRLLPPGAWDEDLLWLFGPEALTAEGEPPHERPCEIRSQAFTAGGYYTLRKEHSWVMLRAHTHRDRPAQCDQLHLDLWWRGQNVLRDCGSYQYYVPGRPEMERYFISARAHNVVEIDGDDPLELVSRFLWLPWPRGRMRHYQADGSPAWFEAEHSDYDRRPWNVLHRRCVIALEDDVWVIVDDLLGEGRHTMTTRWHLMDAPVTLDAARSCATLQTPAGPISLSISSSGGSAQRLEIIRGRDEPGDVQGFTSDYYGEKLPIPTLEAEWRCELPLRIVTVVSPGDPIVPTLAEEGAAGETWTLQTANATQTLQLAPANRKAERILLRCILDGDLATP